MDTLMKKENFALVLTGGEKKTAVLSDAKYAGWLEFRVDEFLKKFSEEGLTRWLSTRYPVRRIGTVRWKKEHQTKGLDIPEKERLEIYRKVVNFVDFLDVEIKSSIASDVVGLAVQNHKKAIASYHNFSRTPSREDLKRIYREGRRLHPDIIKVATLVRSKKELLTLLDFTYRYAGRFPLVVIPMGVPVLERLMPLPFGSLFTYVSLDKMTAPGQISYRVLERIFQL